MNDMEQIVFSLITNSGTARSYAFEAMDEASSGNFEEANKLIDRSKSEIANAHKIQTNLIQKEAAGENTEVNLLLVHAQDHLMTSILAKDLIEKMIIMQRKIGCLQEELSNYKK
jgi:Phosphotransferase system cellobiose-specific component IIA